MQWKCAAACAAIAMALVPSVASADTIGDVENPRAKERQGQYLSDYDQDKLREWGGSGGYGYGRYYAYPADDYGYDDDYDDGPRYRYYRADPY